MSWQSPHAIPLPLTSGPGALFYRDTARFDLGRPRDSLDSLRHVPETDDVVRILVHDVHPAKESAPDQVFLPAVVNRAVDRKLIVPQHAPKPDLAVRILLEELRDSPIQRAVRARPKNRDALDRIHADGLRNASLCNRFDVEDEARGFTVLHRKIPERPLDDSSHLANRDLPCQFFKT